MTSSRPFQNAFTSGELDPLLAEREDFQRHQTGLAICCGFLPLRQGGFTRAPGTIFRGTTRNNNVCRRVPFEFAANDALTLEFTNLRMRVWRYGALVMDGGSPYELTTVYAAADLPNLQWVQDGDVIYMADGNHPIQKLSRFALDNWTIEEAVFDNGPFRVQNLNQSRTMQASASTGSITITRAGGGTFDANWVGSLIRLEPTDIKDIPPWVGQQAQSVGDQVIHDGRIYELTAGSGSGYTAPTHTVGEVRTGAGTVTTYKFISDLVGIARVTGFVDANTVNAEVIKTIPQPCVADPTYRWSEGAWSARRGYPSCLEMYGQRMWAANNRAEPRGVWASVIGDFADFLVGADADDAIAYTISATQTQNEIEWLYRGRKGIFIGALGEVYRGFSNATGQTIGPTTFDTEVVSTDGASGDRPVSGQGFPIHITRGGYTVQELRYSFEQDGVSPVELSLPSQHLGGLGFAQVVWQSKPQKFAYFRMNDGSLTVMSYDPAQDVLGWARVPLAGGFLEDMDVTPGIDSGVDTVTLVVRRTIDGQTVRCVEEVAPIYGVLTGAQPIRKAVHVFSSLVYELGAEQDTFDVAHLVGEDVYAWTEKGQYGPFTVGGSAQITLPVTVQYAAIGLFDDTHYAESLDLRAAAPDGESRGRKRALQEQSGISIYKTAAGKVAAVERNIGREDFANPPRDLVQVDVLSDLTTAYSGLVPCPVVSGYTDAVRLRYFPVGAAPMTVTAHAVDIHDAGA